MIWDKKVVPDYERRKDTKELYEFIGKTTEAINNIGSAVSSNMVALQNHEQMFHKVMHEHKEKEEGWQRRIEESQIKILEKAVTCPESGHILDQNGKIGRLTIEVAETRGTVKQWCWYFAAILSFLTITVGILVKVVIK